MSNNMDFNTSMRNWQWPDNSAKMDDKEKEVKIQEGVKQEGIKDSLKGADVEMQQTEKTAYSAAPNFPKLGKPLSPEQMKELKESGQMVDKNGSPVMVANKMMTENAPEANFMMDFQNELYEPSDPALKEQMQQYKEQNGLSQEKFFGQIRFAQANPETPTDPEMQEIVKTLESQVAEKVQGKMNLPNPPNTKEAGKLYNAAIDLTYDNSMQKTIEDAASNKEGLENLTEEEGGVSKPEMQAAIKEMGLEGADTKKLLFAQAHPELADQLDPQTKELLAKIKEYVSKEMSEKMGTPDGWEPEKKPDKTDAKVTGDYEKAFDDALQEAAKSLPLTPEEVTQMKAMHAMPDGAFPDNPKLKKLLETLNQQAFVEIAEMYGIPDSWKPAPATSSFKAKVAGDFAAQFSKALKKQTPPLSDSEMAEVMEALKNPSAPMSEKVKQIIDNVVGEVSAKIKSKYALPDDWEVPPLQTLAVNPKSDRALRNNALDLTEEIHGHAQKIVQGMPPGSDQVVYADFLKAVSDALNKLKEFIFEMMGIDTEVSKALNLGQKDTKMNQLEAQRHQIEAARDQLMKQATMGAVMDILGPLMAIFTLGIGFLCGPIAFIVAVVIVVMQFTHGFQKLFEFITKLLKSIFSFLPDSVTDALIMVVKIMLIVVIMMAASGAGPMIMMMLFFQLVMDSGILKDFADMIGLEGQAAMIFEMVVMIVMMIAAMVVMMLCPPAALEAAGAMAAEAMTMVTTYISKFVDAIVKFMVRAMEILGQLMDKLGKFGSILKTIGNSIKQAVQFIAEQLTTFVKWISDGIKDIWTSIKTFFEGLPAKIEEFVSKITDGLGKAYNKVMPQSVKEFIQPALDSIKQSGTEFAENTGKFMKDWKELGEINKSLMTAKPGDPPIDMKNLERAQEMMTKVQRFMDIGGGVLQIANSSVNIASQLLQAEMALRQGRFDAWMKEVDAIIKIIKKAIDILLSGLTPLGEWAANVTNQQQKNWSDLSEATTALFQAS